MVGRALRGESAGGTKDAYIVSFIDDWEDKIAFENPQSILFTGEPGLRPDPKEYTKRNIMYIAVSLVEEFAKIVDETVDTSEIEGLPFSERIPLGLYRVSYMEVNAEDETSIERNHTILVYNCSKDAVEQFIDNLKAVIQKFGIDSDGIGEDSLDKVIRYCREEFFHGSFLPPVRNIDIEALLKYYIYHGYAPKFDEIDKFVQGKLNLSYLAQDVVGLSLGPFEEKDYLEERWNDETNYLKTFYIDYEYFHKQYEKEKYKLVYGVKSTPVPTVSHPDRPLEEFTLQEIKARDPKTGFQIEKGVYDAARSENGMFRCECCGMISPRKADFQIDHIKPMSKGGLTVIDNLQLLCRHCNLSWSDHEDDLPLHARSLSEDALPKVVRNGDVLTVSLGDHKRNYTINEARKKKPFFFLTVNDVKYKFYPASNKLERAVKKKDPVIRAEVQK